MLSRTARISIKPELRIDRKSDKPMRKRKAPQDTPTNGGRWFLTYSDMITLLLALFLMLYAMSNVNEQKYKAMATGFHSAFGTATESGTGSGTGNAYFYIPGITTSTAPSGSAVVPHSDKNAGDALAEIYNILQNYIVQNDLQDEIEIKDTGAYVQVHLKDVVLFKPNSAVMLDSSKPIIQEIEKALAKVYNRIDHITISGHTADIVVDPQHSDAISWQLSTDRAVTVLNELITNGLSEQKLSIQGYAHYDPIATNSTEEGRSKNRRVEITIYKNPVVGTGATGREKATLDSSDGSSPSSSASSDTPASTVPSSVPKN
jgi:chemotaxis protein MotB